MKLRLPTILTTLLLATSALGAGTTTISKNDAVWDDDSYDSDYDWRTCELDYYDTNLKLSKSVSFGSNTWVTIYWSGNEDETYTITGSGSISAEGVHWELGSGTYIFSNSGTIAGGENSVWEGDTVILDTTKLFDQFMSVDTLIIKTTKPNVENIDAINVVESAHELATKNIGGLIGGASVINADVLVNGVGPDRASIWIDSWTFYAPEINGHVTFKSKTPVYYAIQPTDDYYFSKAPTDAEIETSLKDLEQTTILSCETFTGNPALFNLKLEYEVYNEYTDYYRYYSVSGAKYGTFLPLYNYESGMFDIVFRSYASAQKISADDVGYRNGYDVYDADDTDLYLSKSVTLSPDYAVFSWYGNDQSLALFGKGTISGKKGILAYFQDGYFTLASGCSFKNADYYLEAASLTVTDALTANSLYLDGSVLWHKGKKLTVKDGINGEQANLVSQSAVNAGFASFQGKFLVEGPKAISVTFKDKYETNYLTSSVAFISGKLSVSGHLNLNDSLVYLYDPSGKDKAQSITVKGNMTFDGSSLEESFLITNGTISAGNLELGTGTIILRGEKQQTIKASNTLTLNGETSLFFGFKVKEKDVAKGKAFKIFTFKHIDPNLTDDDLADLLDIGTNAATLSFDKKRKAITLTVTDYEDWTKYAEYIHEEFDFPPYDEMTAETLAATDDDELTESAGVDNNAYVLAPAAAVNPLLGKVADTLVQSIWGTAGASRAFADTIAARGTHATALADGKGAAWLSTMGGSSRISSDGAHAGADYTLMGAAFGMEANLGEKSTIGLAIGNSWGKVSTFSAFPVDADSSHQGIYGKHVLGSSTMLSWMAAHTRTESDANLAGMPCDWTQDALQLDARVDKLFAISDRTTVSAFVGMQYLATDKGECNGMSTGSLQNLRGEIGVSAAHKATDKAYVYGELSFIGDMVRHNPTATVGDYRSRGANPGRAGLNLSVGGSYQLNEDWSLNASYKLELMQNQTSHSANVGATYSF